jgi:YidC/Oxa1 family membrane protein insertase
MEKRILIAFVLSFAVLYAFSWLFPSRAPAPTSAPPAEKTETAPPSAAPAAIPAKALSPVAPTGDIQAQSAEDVVVDTDLYTATLSNAGGVLRSFQLNKFKDKDGKPTELINQQLGPKVGWPLAIATGDAALDQQLQQAKFVTKRDGPKVSMEFAQDEISARRTIEFDPENYAFSISTAVFRSGKPVPHRLVWQSGFGDQSLGDDPKKKQAIYETPSKFQHLALGSVKGPQEFTTARAGVEDQYFLAAFLLPEARPVTISKVDVPTGDGKTTSSALRVEAKVPEAQPVRVYIGPKQESALKDVDPQLAGVINYGWFEIIAKPLLAALQWIHHYVGNYGWAIVILTCAINFVLFPLRLKSQVSMQKMQKIQPQLKTLMDKQKKLKQTDPRRAEVQQEIMNLYNEHGVNPMGGCLPMLLQMPLLIAFYSMLSVSIELRGAPWILWIRDLSQPENLLIPVLPLLMAASMMIQQKMTPTTVDPAQAKTMMLMPIMMTFIFLWAQSGLTLYWLTSNVVGIGQQWFIRKYWGAAPPEPEVIKNKTPRAR